MLVAVLDFLRRQYYCRLLGETVGLAFASMEAELRWRPGGSDKVRHILTLVFPMEDADALLVIHAATIPTPPILARERVVLAITKKNRLQADLEILQKSRVKVDQARITQVERELAEAQSDLDSMKSEACAHEEQIRKAHRVVLSYHAAFKVAGPRYWPGPVFVVAGSKIPADEICED